MVRALLAQAVVARLAMATPPAALAGGRRPYHNPKRPRFGGSERLLAIKPASRLDGLAVHDLVGLASR